MAIASSLRVRALALASLCISAGACSGGHTGALLPQTSGSSAHSAYTPVKTAAARIAAADERALNNAGVTRRTMSVTPSNTTTADPPVLRPATSPCVVTLLSNAQFANFTPATFAYTPPAACPGPWSKVVFNGDFSVTAGRQFDRTASIWIAGTNVYFGTTAEPSAGIGPSWHVERDVTDLSAIFKAPSTGEAVLGNLVNSTYTGVISGTATLQFYPANTANPAPAVADGVYPLSGGPLGDNQYIGNPSQPLTATYTLPHNVRAAYLDVFLQSQGGDEFWYTCFPNDLAQELNNCGNTAFREGDVAIDGQPAGVVPVYPWIYTGGIDPYLWRPIPGVETLNFKPYRVDLTPLAAVLSNGQPHTITVNVVNNGNYFAANGALLVYLDPGTSQITGGLISDTTAAAPATSVSDGVKFDKQGNAKGTVTVTASHGVSLDGYVNTSSGRVETQIHQQIAFSNAQQVDATATLFDQNITQSTTVTSDTATITGSGARSAVHQEKSWPLRLNYGFVVNADGSAVQTVSVNQGKIEQRTATATGSGTPLQSYLSNVVNSTDVLTFPAAGGDIPSNGASSQTYSAHTNTGYCYSKTVKSANYLITNVTGGFC